MMSEIASSTRFEPAAGTAAVVTVHGTEARKHEMPLTTVTQQMYVNPVTCPAKPVVYGIVLVDKLNDHGHMQPLRDASGLA